MARNDDAALRLAHPTVVPADPDEPESEPEPESDDVAPAAGMDHPTVVPGRSD